MRILEGRKRASLTILSIVIFCLLFMVVEWSYTVAKSGEKIRSSFATAHRDLENKATGFESTMTMLKTSLDIAHRLTPLPNFHIPTYGPNKYAYAEPEIGSFTYVGAAPSPQTRLLLASLIHLLPMLKFVKESHADVPWVYFTSSNFIYLYPYVAPKDFFFDVHQLTEVKEFYRLGKKEFNPLRATFWTSPYIDLAGQGLMMTLATPFDIRNQYLGTIAIDFKFDVFAQSIGQLKMQHGDLLLLGKNQELLSENNFQTKSHTIENQKLIKAELTPIEIAQLREPGKKDLSLLDGQYVIWKKVPHLDLTLYFRTSMWQHWTSAFYDLKASGYVFLFALFLIVGVILVERSENARIKISEETNRLVALGEMCGGIAHEINNPLAIIKGNLSLVMKKIELDQEIKPQDLLHRLRLSDQTVDRIKDIVQGLRFFSKDYDRSRHEEFDLKEVFEMTIPLIRGRLQKENIEIEVELAQSEYRVLGSRVEISQVLINLVNNATDAITEHQSTGRRWIRLRVDVRHPSIRIEVQDSGLGISDQLTQTVFQPFYSTKSRKRKDRFGLGLSICKGIIEAHQGRIYYEKPDQVSTFVIELPLLAPPQTVA